ncbi:SGNH/GDSL hydrolase family protein [Arthrobacter sp. B1805]|uniref:SGNH/GDSL hydrolase family protein n=1 Tax=Arthrobacter sp. B1805 TaxID=2058892 RepID=UPI0015E3D843|nr:SGNH/GDSL hydrolase family protein [Arthrobacter sp. B1805]
MYRSGREQRRAALTAGASFAAGALLVATAAVGGIVSSHPGDTTGSVVSGPVTTGSVDTNAASAPFTGAPSSGDSGATSHQAGLLASQAGTIAAGAHNTECINPVTGGPGQPLADARRTALLIGDSQSSGAAGVSGDHTWTQTGLRNAGYDVQFLGAGGTGFVAANNSGGLNYTSAMTQGQWVMPCSDPALIVVEGGGNDATQGATDAQIIAGADALVSSLTQHYPTSKIVLVGTLAKGATDGGRRTAVDGLLGTYADAHGIAFISAGDWLTRYQAVNLMADGVHLTQAGHDRLAAVLTHQMQAKHLLLSDLSA